MIMKIINSEEHLCTCCMEKHEVKTVLVREQATFKNVKITYDAVYFYCDTAVPVYEKIPVLRLIALFHKILELW